MRGVSSSSPPNFRTLEIVSGSFVCTGPLSVKSGLKESRIFFLAFFLAGLFSDTVFLNSYTEESVDKFIELIQTLICSSSKEKE